MSAVVEDITLEEASAIASKAIRKVVAELVPPIVDEGDTPRYKATIRNVQAKYTVSLTRSTLRGLFRFAANPEESAQVLEVEASYDVDYEGGQ